jgi:hypothetical protein
MNRLWTWKQIAASSKRAIAEYRTRKFQQLQKRNVNIHNRSIATTSSFLLTVGLALLKAHSIA